ncbi:hypothetical protein [Allonocardiopsis opalescens]|uniref:Uncharacterized protein n=1 Tax=Allonocardiopsis opalescens TaxID=1144618 RepID=A0A2T0PSX2_9ACTN|nr:hypothetical protein [Allonocardiopsis opalescens]PRX91999.1 hypothetical protein CLV72_11272 [Allonocardiopsis opalescens]
MALPAGYPRPQPPLDPPADAPPDAVRVEEFVPEDVAPWYPPGGDTAVWVRTGGVWRYGWVHGWKRHPGGRWGAWIGLAHVDGEHPAGLWAWWWWDGVSVRRRQSSGAASTPR